MKIAITFIALMILSGCSDPGPGPKFTFGTHGEVTSGFYLGCRGLIRKVGQNVGFSNFSYLVIGECRGSNGGRLYFEEWVKETDLKVVE